MIADRFTIKGRLKITITNAKTGEIEKTIIKDNLIVNDGLKLILDKFGEDASGSGKTGPDYIWIGDGSTAAGNSDTDLDSYQSEKQIDTYLRSAAEFTATFSTSFGTGDSNHEWEEAGLANGTHGSGELISRVVFTSSLFTKDNTQLVTVDWDITAARG